ncbi:MAG: hypothetical protein P8Y03_16445 [Anaerolineales bacterium]
MQFVNALLEVLPVILLILAGIYLRKKQFIKPATVADLKSLVVNITLPALLFLAFSRVDIQPSHLVIVVIVFITGWFVLLMGRRIQPFTRIEAPQFAMLMTGFEAGMMGYAIFTAVYGDENIFKFALIDLGQVTFVFFVLVPALQGLSDPKSFSHTVRGFFRTPIIIAILAGIFINQTGFMARFSSAPFVSSLLDTLVLVSSLTTPLVALIIGYEVRLQKGDLTKPLASIGLRLAFWIPFALLFNALVIDRWLGLDAGFQVAVLTMFILPPPFVIPIFMHESDSEDKVYVVNTLSLGTIVTLFAFAMVNTLY